MELKIDMPFQAPSTGNARQALQQRNGFRQLMRLTPRDAESDGASQIIRDHAGLGAIAATGTAECFTMVSLSFRPSLAGFAPVIQQSGRKTGRAFIRAGWAHLWQGLYLPALVAMRVNPDLKAKD